jgi:RimJ/RimL family protein N-acetyltransferase
MIDQRFISPATQIKWFESLKSSDEMHFVYHLGSEDIGVVNIKPDSKREFIAGIYCGNPDYLGHPVNVSAAVALYNFAFSTLNFELSKAKVLETNSAALRLNLFLGYEISRTEAGLCHLELRSEEFFTRSSVFGPFVSKAAIDGFISS